MESKTNPDAVSLVEALKPFAAVFNINEPLAENWPDDKPNHSFSPGLWPTWGDFKRAAAALANHEAQARGGVDREALARIIDPEAWTKFLGDHSPMGFTPESRAEMRDRARALSLTTTDRILALLQQSGRELPAHQPRQEGEDNG